MLMEKRNSEGNIFIDSYFAFVILHYLENTC
jgi:hypothetical protein